jgi:hypothetical protein
VVTREPDGTLRLAPGAGHLWARRGAFFAMLGYAAFSLGHQLIAPGWESLGPGDRGLMHAILGVSTFAAAAAMGAVGLWAFWESDEWRVGRDFLQIRRRLFGREWTRTYTGARLELTRCCSRYGQPFRLVVHGQPDEPSFGDYRRTLDTASSFGSRGLRSLGRFLAEHTGWRFEENVGLFGSLWVW